MTTKWPSSCFGAVSSRHNVQLFYDANASSYTTRISAATFLVSRRHVRHYAVQPPAKQATNDLDRPEKAALVEIKGLRKSDPVNPPLSTLPPPLNPPEKSPGQLLPIYYFKIGKAYGSFYWRGIKAVWFNYQASKLLRERLRKDAGNIPFSKIDIGKKLGLMSRSEFQLLARNGYDIGKLPFFGLLVALFGEWLPLLVPFIPGAVPGTCRIPKQVEGMRKKAEERRRLAFRMGVQEPEIGSVETEWGMLRKNQAHDVVVKLRDDQLFHLSSTLNLHNRLWDRLQLPPPSVLLRRAVTRHLVYITADDYLLLRHGGGTAPTLTSKEVFVACEERGLDVLGKKEDTLRNELAWWLAKQREDEGRGRAVLTMLFRRPNAWDTKKIAPRRTK